MSGVVVLLYACLFLFLFSFFHAGIGWDMYDTGIRMLL
jgi:hypothetical protein